MMLCASLASANAELTGFAQVRQVERALALPDCSRLGACRTMSQEALVELLAEQRLGTTLNTAVRVEGYYDRALSLGRVNLREGFVDWSPSRTVGIKAGRQILTWGVSDYLYVNDVFPKNYDGFFTGAGFDRMKEPVDAVKLSASVASVDVEAVVSKTKADRMPNPERFSATIGAESIDTESPASGDVDLAAKAAGHTGGWDLAAYAARLRSRETRVSSTAGALRSDRPRLTHFGVSATGNAGGGVAWSEAALRHYDDDRHGVVNRSFLGSSAKWIAGFSREVAADTTVSIQLQLEGPLSRSRYLESLAIGVRPVKSISTTLHLRAQGRWNNQTLGAGAQLFATAEGDTHFNPFASWSPVDGWAIEGGANLFSGKPDTRYGAFKDDSNVYVLGRISF